MTDVSPPSPKKPKVFAGGTFEEITFDEAYSKYGHYIHAAHAMIHAPDGDALWDGTVKKASILMQFRFDGNIGFPGGLLDKGDTEEVVEGLNRELEEEIGLNLKKFSFAQTDHVFTHKNDARELVTHFYTKKVNAKEFFEIEQGVLTAKEWGVETMGTIRAPLYVMDRGSRGFPVFLCNNFAGNASTQLVEAVRRCKIIPEADLDQLLKVHEIYKKTKENF